MRGIQRKTGWFLVRVWSVVCGHNCHNRRQGPKWCVSRSRLMSGLNDGTFVPLHFAVLVLSSAWYVPRSCNRDGRSIQGDERRRRLFEPSTLDEHAKHLQHGAFYIVISFVLNAAQRFINVGEGAERAKAVRSVVKPQSHPLPHTQTPSCILLVSGHPRRDE
ncbi:hypothetical protein J3459_007651 [Metarhizium acridum]|uniref:uncharacterized protein n=1 Tax=Metarhizium acridum TaxID=92637 RepID=UPI001C6B1806|nr:hypothetical protein J3458_007111 [Metarhizium acridum]KAG8426984.1 hypothetical protein J3459_007651 [Metarhizium acridum]